ncbi:tonB-system energizer ExbB [Acidimangrovimonas sediminis]|uniref:tonB-system energizer ExbB n=1 Tax=Acidimangrovimonas sediminis TaxID=2056283 RepID=UPI0022B8E202|nr:tonB-system energizer ExbB [Acidimangrovimonas sediminis]
MRGPTAGRGAAVPAPGAPADTARAGPHAPPTAGPAARADLPRDLSPAGMFLHADRVVKAVMILLGLASLATWVIWLAKMVEFAGARRALGRVALVLATARRLDEAAEAGAGPGPAALMIAAAGEEAALSAGALDRAGTEGMKERVASALDQIEAHALRRMRRGTGILATIGATAPFVGLFGTVWGIMNAFVGISQAQTTNLAVVAPGIAEALMATAAGLVAAIPAVVIYNLFTRRTAAYRAGLRDVAAGIERLVSRDADYRRLPGREG